MPILATGGAGYIGSHTVLELLQAGHDVVVLDNLSNSSEVALQRVAAITGKAPVFILGDVNDPVLLAETFARYEIAAVMHFAGLISVSICSRPDHAFLLLACFLLERCYFSTINFL